MQIRIKDNARELYIATQNVHRQPINWEWADMLRAVEGEVLEVETDWLFNDQYNTAPIPGVSDKGMRIMQQSVAEIIDDVRPRMQRCGWCGYPSLRGVSPCPHCGRDDHLRPFLAIPCT